MGPATRELWNQFQAGNGMTAPRSLLANPFLYTLPFELWNKVKEPWEPVVNITPLAASLAQSGDFKVDGATWFCILGAVATVRDTTNATILTNVPQLVQIQDQTQNLNFYSQPTDFMNVFGTGQEPAWWSLPRIINPAGTVQVTLTNLEATARNVRITFKGFKIYNRDLTPTRT